MESGCGPPWLAFFDHRNEVRDRSILGKDALFQDISADAREAGMHGAIVALEIDSEYLRIPLTR